MKKISLSFMALIGGLVIAGNTFAADVGARKSCAEIQAQINSLAALETPDNTQTTELVQLRETYRRDCVKRASGRARSTGMRTPVITDDASAVVETTENIDDAAVACTTPDANGCCPGEVYTDMGDQGFNCCPTDGGMCFAPMVVEPVAPVKTDAEIAEEIAANIAKGLCADGSKPNKYGCCGAEVFKDLGNTVFACCQPDGGECFPPIK